VRCGDTELGSERDFKLTSPDVGRGWYYSQLGGIWAPENIRAAARHMHDTWTPWGSGCGLPAMPPSSSNFQASWSVPKTKLLD